MGTEGDEAAHYLEPNPSEAGGLARAVGRLGTTSLGSKLAVWAFDQYSDEDYEIVEDYPQSVADVFHNSPVDRDAALRNDVVVFEDGQNEDILRQVPEATEIASANIVDQANSIVSEERANGERTVEYPNRDSSTMYLNPTEEGFLDAIPSSRFADAEPIDESFGYIVLENAERGQGEGELRVNGFYDIESEGALLHDLHLAFAESPYDVAGDMSQ